MTPLPIYRELPLLPVETTQPMQPDPGCSRCRYGDYTRGKQLSPGLSFEGAPGGALLLGDFPTQEEMRGRRVLTGAGGQLLRFLVQKHWKGPVAYDTAIRCAVENTGYLMDAAPKCRPYTAHTLKELKPTRILAFGSVAFEVIAGRAPSPFSVRKGFTWLVNKGGDPIPVYFLISPGIALRNRFVKGWLEKGVQWALTNEAPPYKPNWRGASWTVETAEDAHEVVTRARAARWASVDAEWRGVMHDPDFKLLSLAITPAPESGEQAHDGYVWTENALESPATWEPLRKYLINPAAKKVGQNFKEDMHAIQCGKGVWVQGLELDTRFVRKLLDPEADAHSLRLLAELTGEGGQKDEMAEAIERALDQIDKVLERRKRSNAGFLFSGMEKLLPEIDPEVNRLLLNGADSKRYTHAYPSKEVLHRYNAADTVTTANVAVHLEREMAADRQELREIWEDVVKPMSASFAKIENAGLKVDFDAAKNLSAFLLSRQEQLGVHFEPYGFNLKAFLRGDKNVGPFNPNSSDDVPALLYDKLKLTPPEGGGRSADRGTLVDIVDQHPIVKHIIEWRRVTRSKNVYADGMRDLARADHRIHATLNPDGARTGRISIQDPSLQNILSPFSLEGKLTRDIFVAEAGYTLVEADYSQLELRIAALLSKDPKMCAIFGEYGVDYHMRTAKMLAKLVWGISPEEITDAHRTAVKRVNFGLAYGKGDRSLAAEIGCAIVTARKIREAIFGTFTVFAAWTLAQKREAFRTGESWTWWKGKRARRRPLFRIANADSASAGTAERGAVNSPIQGTGNEFCLASINAITDHIERDGLDARIVLPIHDSIMAEVKDEQVDEYVYHARRIMQGWPSEGVPLVVDIKIGKRWGSMQKVKAA